jgi:hypothetical protein
MNSLISFLVANKASVAFIVKEDEVNDYLRIVSSKLYRAKPAIVDPAYSASTYIQNEKRSKFEVGAYVIGTAKFNKYSRATINICIDTTSPTDLSVFDVVYNSSDDTIKCGRYVITEDNVPKKLVQKLAKLNSTVPYVINKKMANYCEVSRIANGPIETLLLSFFAKAAISVAFNPVDDSSVKSLVKTYLKNMTPVDFVYPLSKSDRNVLLSDDVSFATDMFMKGYLTGENIQEGNVIVPILGKYNKASIPVKDTIRYVGKYKPEDFNVDVKILTRGGKILEISTPEVTISVSNSGMVYRGKLQEFFNKYTKQQNSYLVNLIKRRL